MEKLTQQVDDTIDVADFLKSSEQGIIKEKKKCVDAMEEKDVIEALNTLGIYLKNYIFKFLLLFFQSRKKLVKSSKEHLNFILS